MATVTGSQRQLAHTSDTYTSNGNITVGGNLEVQGTTTTIDTANLLVEDKNIVIGNVTTPTDTTADGGGITLKGATDKTLNWVDSTDSWTSNQTFSAPNLSLTSLSSGASATTALMLSGTTVVTRALGSAAFSNTSAFAAAGDENIIDGATSIWNADGDGDVFAYDDSNPTHNGKYVGAIIDIRGDGASTSSLVKAGIFTSNHVSTTDGYYVGTILGATNSSTTQVINSSGEWTGAVIPSAKLDTDTAHLSGTQTFTGNKTFNYNVSDLDSVGGQAGVTPFKSQFQATNRAGSGNYNTGLEFTFHDTTARGQLVFGSDGNNVIPAIYARTEGWSGNNGWHDWYELWHSGNDGTGSGLDADTVDGIQASSFLRSDANDSATGVYTFTNTVYFGTNPSNPGRIEIADNSTTDYKLRILGTGTRAFELQGSGSTADFNTSFTNASTGSHHISVAGNITVGGTVDGRDVASDGSKLDGIAAGANNYSHPTHPGDDINIDTGALTGATVISDLDFNVTTDTLGHVTDANAAISTRNLTYSDVGAAASSHSHDDRYYTETESDARFLGITAKAADSEKLDGVDGVVLAQSLRAGLNVTGGGTITVSSGAYIKNSSRFIVIASGKGSNFATSGYWDINIPTSGTITGVGGASNATATSDGVPLAVWEALYYILPIGSGSSSQAANFRIVDYTANVDIPYNWILLAVRNGDSTNNQVYFLGGKYILGIGQSINTLTYNSRRIEFADKLTTTRNIALTGAVTGNANFDGSGNISIATTATSDPTLTINGDASGSATFTNLGNATLTLTIADDSHNHTIANVDGLQTALDGKQASGTYNTIIGTDSDINTSGSTIIDNIYVTDGVITSMGTRTLAASDISALTQSDFEELLWQNTGRIFSPMNNPLRYSSNGTTGALDGVCFTRAEVTTTANAWAQNCLTRTTTNEISWSGGGTEFSRKLGASFKCAFVASGTQAQSIRFMFGGRANSVQAAGGNPLASKGFGVEFRSRTGTTIEWRVIAHDGVYFSASGWSDIPSNTTGNYLKELYIYSDGSGNISAGLDDRGGDGSSWTTKTTTGGPTGNGNSTYPYLVNEVINASSGSSYARSRIYDYKIFSE